MEQAFQVIALSDQEHRPLLTKAYPDWPARIDYWSIENESRWEPGGILSHIECQVGLLVKALSASAPAKSPG